MSTSAPSAPVPAAGAPPDLWPTAVQGWIVVALLTLANVVSLVDRQILTLLVQPIRRDLGLSDTGISLLHGFAFALFYSVMALPIARLADAGSRRTIIAAGIAVWSLATAACGLAKSFWPLFAARVGVGVGEATLAPTGNSLIADLFPPERRALPLGVFAAGIAGGMGVSLMAGGAVIAAAAALGPTPVPGLGTVQPWQMVFFAVGLGGLPVAALMLLVREPARRGAGGAAHVPLREAAAFLRDRRAVLAPLIAGYTLLVASANAIAAWTPAFYMRSFGLGAPETGFWMGAVILCGGPLGGLLGGWLADRRQRAGDGAAAVRVLMICALALVVPAAVAPLMPTVAGALAFLFWTFVLGSATVGPTIAALHALTPNRLRAQVVALLYFFVNLIGLGVGPLAVAVVTDYVFADDLAVRWSIALVATVLAVAGAAFCLRAFAAWRRA